MALQMYLHAVVNDIQTVLEVCARHPAARSYDQVSFVADIAQFVRLCSQSYQSSSSASSENVPMKYSNWCFSWIGNRISLPILADHALYLYTTAKVYSAAQHHYETPWKCKPNMFWQSVPDVLAELECSLRRLLGSQEIMLLLVEEDGDG